MDFKNKHIEAIQNSNLLADSKELDFDTATDVFLNEAPIITSWEAEQDQGPYTICVRGINGAYFIEALEYEDIGVFDTLEEAEFAVGMNYGEFIIE